MNETSVNFAVDLAAHGLYPVRLHYPIFRESSVSCSCGNPNCGGSTGKHPVNKQWGKSASLDEEVIRDQFGTANWNVGIILGICHGIPADQAIIDIEDDSEEGRALADVLLADYPAPTYSSGKSLHRIYRWSEDLPSVANMTIDGLEFRFGGKGLETQSVAPPSVHYTGSQYQWLPGRSLNDLPIIPLPQHVIEFLQEESARRAHNSKSGPSSTDPKKFRSPRGKIGPGARHHSLLIEANRLWRIAYNQWGINGFDEQEVIDQVWMWLAGVNLLVCEPPKTEAEVQVILNSARSFMLSEIEREIDEKLKQRQELTAPTPDPPRSLQIDANESGDSEQVGSLDGDDDAPETFSGWLHRHGINLRPDRSLNWDEKSPDRIDEWVSKWRMEYLTKGDEDLIKVTFGIDGVEDSIMNHSEFKLPDAFAKRVQQDTIGKMCLDRTFSYWNWKTIWLGRSNDKNCTNGITRGLREYLLAKAKVVAQKEQSLSEQVEDLVLSIAGPLSEIESGIEDWEASGMTVPAGRLKINGAGQMTHLKAPEDPMTGWYLVSGELLLLAKIDEVTRRYRASYGGVVQNRKISEAMLEELKFERKKFPSGSPIAGRWFVRNAK